ncbi:hypothetical protein FQA39_LY00152 [Lamprigera yunnana]|nr:hypothetical protein FQA39_LY00152 [Lamprigera yunnana]
MSVTNEVKEFYTNDIVYRFDKRKRMNVGVVVDSYEASTEEDESDELKKGQIRVWWLNSTKETVWKQNKVRLMSRSIIPGDIVRRLENGKETQRGYCKETKQYATVKVVGTDRIIERVNADRLSTVTFFEYNVAVCLGTKFGRIQGIDQKIRMLSKCGSIVEIFSSINHCIEDYWSNKRKQNYCDIFYPSQEVTCIPNNLEQPQWIHRSNAMKRSMQSRQRFTIQSVKPMDIEVSWYDSMSSACHSEIKATDFKKLKVVEPLENSHLELAERRLLKLNLSDVLVKKRDWIRKQSALHQPEHHKVLHIVNRTTKKDRGSKLSRPSMLTTCVNIPEPEEDGWTEDGEDELSDNETSSSTMSCRYRSRRFPPKLCDLIPGLLVAVEVLCMDSKVTVVWQDGTEEKDIPTTQLYYSISLDDHEFFPGEWVVQDEKNETHYGAIQFVNHLERTATVKWFKYSKDLDKPQLITTNEMSVYDLKKHSNYAFRPGSIVKRIPVEAEKLGTVLDSCPEGYVIVKWINGELENCWPHSLELIPDSIEYEYSLAEDNTDQGSWETESIESIAGDLTDESTLQNMAARLDFVRCRVTYLKDVLKQQNSNECFLLLKELLMIYDNSSYLDKLLDTSFFSLKSRHFQVLLAQIKEKAKNYGVELRGRLFSTVENLGSSLTRSKNPEKENISKVLKLEFKIASHLEGGKEATRESFGEPSTPISPECEYEPALNENICVELLSMMKVRMDLAYAEIISRIGGPQALTVMTKASDDLPKSSTPLPSIPKTPDDDNFGIMNPFQLKKAVNGCDNAVYRLLDEVHFSHRFYNNKFEPTDKQRFLKAVQKEFKLLKESLPSGVWVRSYANRMDLLSVMIEGPKKTPYEDGLFLFDLQLSSDYPRSPPLCHYITYNSERLNPNLYVEGKVCISLLGTWLGKGSEIWGPNSTLLQLIVSIQGLILVAEPYYNEAGYEKQIESQQGYENSRTYNELVILKLVQSMTQLLISPPEVFRNEIYGYYAIHGDKLCNRLERWCDDSDSLKPEFPLLSVSKGLKLSLNSALKLFQEALKATIQK